MDDHRSAGHAVTDRAAGAASLEHGRLLGGGTIIGSFFIEGIMKLAWLLACCSWLGCGNGESGPCTPGQSVMCTGPGGCAGAQICAGDGKSFTACDCGDAGVPDDASMDLSMAPDLTPPPANGQVLLADVGGTAYRPGASAGTEISSPYAHLLLTVPSFAMFATAPQYADPTLSQAPGALHGCIANRYDLSAGPFPPTDVDVGVVSYHGYTTALFSADARTTTSLYTTPVPDTIRCAWGGAVVPYYGCVFGGTSTDMANTVEGESTSAVVFPAFPPVPPYSSTGTCPAGTTMRTGGITTVCEQHPIATGSNLVDAIAGGSGWGALSNQAVPVTGTISDPVTVISVGGAAPANPADPLAGVVLDGSSDVTITWSCDGSNTAGSGCPSGPSGLLDLATLIAVASPNPRSMFAITGAYGVAQCTEQLGPGTVTLSKAAVMRMLGSQTGGSISLSLIRLSVNPASTMGHNVFFSGGKGYYALLSH
jgi:hypothetical protein